MSMVQFRAAPPQGPRWIPRRFRSRRFEIRGDGARGEIVDLTGLADLCGGGRNVDFPQCLTLAWRLAAKQDERWVGYPYAQLIE